MARRAEHGARRRAEGRGRRAERIALWWLRLKGYRLVARRLRQSGGEIDLLMRRGRLVAAVEVKARADVETALQSVTPRQRRRIARAAEQALARDPALRQCSLRFDVVVLVPGRLPRHIVDAWRPD